MSALGIRDLVQAISPTWLAGIQGVAAGVGQRLLYDFGLMSDVVLEKLNQGVKARMPTECDPSALALIGADRSIPQGPNEPDNSYRVRLRRSFETWQKAGSDQSVLIQLLGYLSPNTPQVTIVNDTSTWQTYRANADPASAPFTVKSNNWTWDYRTQQKNWWQEWVIFYSATGPWTNEGTWGDGQLWGDGGTWGSTATEQDVTAIRQQIVKLWKGAHASVQWIIVSFDTTLFDPAQSAGGGVNPDNNFGHWSKLVSGVQVPARFDTAIYWDGVT